MPKGCRHKWQAIRTIWPYKDGYGTYCTKCRSLLDSGLSKQEAQDIADKMNSEVKSA